VLTGTAETTAAGAANVVMTGTDTHTCTYTLH
jgi:hypothetical protein